MAKVQGGDYPDHLFYDVDNQIWYEPLADGTATARDLQARFPGRSPEELAQELKVPIESTDDDPLVGSIWRFAEYRPRPPRIVLYSRGQAPLEAMLVGTMATRLLGRATPPSARVFAEAFAGAPAGLSELGRLQAADRAVLAIAWVRPVRD